MIEEALNKYEKKEEKLRQIDAAKACLRDLSVDVIDKSGYEYLLQFEHLKMLIDLEPVPVGNYSTFQEMCHSGLELKKNYDKEIIYKYLEKIK